MNRRSFITLLGGGVAAWPLLAAGSLGLAVAQVNCETLPAGPARTDCFIGFSRINQQKSKISASIAQQQAETIHRKVTGKRPNNKRRRTVPTW